MRALPRKKINQRRPELPRSSLPCEIRLTKRAAENLNPPEQSTSKGKNSKGFFSKQEIISDSESRYMMTRHAHEPEKLVQTGSDIFRKSKDVDDVSFLCQLLLNTTVGPLLSMQGFDAEGNPGLNVLPTTAGR